MAVKTYSPDRVKVTVGAHTLTGYADGTFVSVEQLTDGVTSQAGADGEVARAMSADKRCKITLTLQQTSRSNDMLTAMYEADQLSGGDMPVPLTVRDLRGTTIFAAGAAWIVKKATAEFCKEISEREWTLEADGAQYFVGGNQ